MKDRNYGTRWHTGNPGQHANEWLRLRFSKINKIKGVIVSTGEFASDFPRGIEVLISSDCPEEFNYKEDLKDYRQVFYANPWKGRTEYTEKGYPYFGSQSEVGIYFNETEQVQCLVIKQLAVSPKFDWSVAEVFFYE